RLMVPARTCLPLAGPDAPFSHCPAGRFDAHERIVEPSTGDRVEPPLPPHPGIRMTHRLLLTLLLAGASLTACAQSTLPPGSQAQSGKPATEQARVNAPGAPELKIAAGTPAARALEALKRV